jgi:competence protein ComFC
VLLAELGRALLDLAYPARCGGCDRVSGTGFCERCRERLRPIARLGCVRCGEPARPGARALSACPRCSGGRPFDLARAPYLYEDPLRHALRALKFSLRESVAEALADLLTESASPAEEDSARHVQDIPFREVDVVCPVPLHPARERRRGFNQSDLLARRVAEGLGTRYEPRLLVRTRETRPQFGLHPREREENVASAFGHLPTGGELAGQRVLVIDDIITTGATVAACAQALRRAGAKHVWALALARAAPGDCGRA